MQLHLDSRARFRVRLALSMLLLAGLNLACLAEVDGDRATTGECPPGETCSSLTPDGLTFVGHALFDEPVLRLGPVVSGGTFDLGIRSRGGAELPDFAWEFDQPDVFMATRGGGIFGPTEDGAPTVETDAYLSLTAGNAGTAQVRVLDSATRELLDRIPIDVVAVSDISLVVAQDTERTHLYAGCEEMLGVRMMGQQGGEPVRGFDQSFTIRTNTGEVRDETRFWDCVLVDAPSDAEEMEFDVFVAGRRFSRSLPVVSLDEDGLTECPAINLD